MTGTWALGWATNDIVTAAEYKKSVGAIFDTTLGGSAASIDITSISATYANLMLSVYARGDNAATTTSVLMRFNGDAGANYDWQQLRGAAAVASAAEAFANTTLATGVAPGNTAGANLFGALDIFIPHYAGSTNNKTFVSVSCAKVGTTTGLILVDHFGGGWRSNAAINQITLLPTSGNFVTGTRATLYALGA